ncbi:MAG: hypothetical protein IJW98_08535 [Clostridia bacterium]|nr:hypothetical protein [Clostridia bacterium]
MRNLTIQRTKSFVGCLMKVQVYIEDHERFDTVINEVPCRKLFDLKNGEAKSLHISEEAAKIFVIMDQASKNYCNDYYNLPAGTEDVSLTGRNHYNPGAGNPFRFDGVTDEDVLANRKKGGKKGLWILIAALILGVVIGLVSNLDFNLFAVKEKAFTKDGLTLTLTNQFKDVDPGNYVAFYESETLEIMVGTFRDPYGQKPGESVADVTLEEYGWGLIKTNAETARSQLEKDGDLYYYVFDEIFDRKYFTYITYIYKSDDAFWYVDFITEKDNVEEYRDEISQWAHTVTFEGAAQ